MQLIDCDTASGDEGCNGGEPPRAYGYVEQAGGLMSYNSYPYTGVQGETTQTFYYECTNQRFVLFDDIKDRVNIKPVKLWKAFRVGDT